MYVETITENCLKSSRSSGALAKKRIATNLARYGVEFAAQINGASDKMIQTRMLKYGTTAPVHHNAEMSAKWNPLRAAQPKAKRKRTVDGIFWHGLDRAYEDLHSIKQKKYDADRRQDEWFLTNGKKLVRITDKELTAGLLDEASLVARLGG